MRRGLSVVAVLLMLSGTSRAQEIAAPVVAPLNATFSTPAQDEGRPAAKVVDKKFVLVGVALSAAMIGDTKSTFYVMSRCKNCYEADPYAAPFINRGPAVAFTSGEALDITVMAVAAKMKASDRPGFRRTWWVIPIALTTGHIIAMQNNLKLVR